VHPQLEDYLRQIEAIKQDSQNLVAGLSNKQFNWHPAPGSWSIAECLDHLIVVGSLLLARIDEGIEQARTKQLFSEEPFSYGLLGKRFVSSQEPPVKKKVKTFKQYVPPPDRSLDKVVPEFMALQNEFEERIRAADGLNLSRIKISSPVSKLIRFNLAVWFAATAAHERRHLWQAQQVKESINVA
jgi:hypothetical protein